MCQCECVSACVCKSAASVIGGSSSGLSVGCFSESKQH